MGDQPLELPANEGRSNTIIVLPRLITWVVDLIEFFT